MYTQNTPVHVRLWHHDFWRLAFANLLLSMAVYMQIPILPLWLGTSSKMAVAIAMGIFGIGIYCLGPFCSYLVEHYRRSHVYMLSVCVMIAGLGALLYLSGEQNLVISHVWGARLVMGAMYGLAQMVLLSTLVIDTSESFQRTEANHSAAWFGRFGLSLGPILSLTIYPFFGFSGTMFCAMACSLIAVILVTLVHFSFKAPEEQLSKINLDRFFLPHGSILFLNLLMVTTAVGILLSLTLDITFYAMMMAGFLLALLSQKLVFANAELKSEIVSGLFLIGVAILMMCSERPTPRLYLAPVFIGVGIGLIGARFLLFFIKLSNHCQRGTSQSSFFLAWESGLALGLFLGHAFLTGQPRLLLYVALAIILLALALYRFFTHSWYLRNKNR